jgi:hypothetical protein
MGHNGDSKPQKDGDADQAPDSLATAPGGRVWAAVKRATRTWWRYHPAHMAVDVAVGVTQPVLDKYASEKPWQLVGTAAALGAAVVLVRPWRLVSLTGLLLATVKSSGLSSALLSLISAQRDFNNVPEDPTKTN